MQRHTKSVESGAVLHHPSNGFGFSERDARKHRCHLTGMNPLQNYNARFEAAISQSMPSDFEEIVAQKQIVRKRELCLVFRHAQLAETVKRSILINNYQFLLKM